MKIFHEMVNTQVNHFDRLVESVNLLLEDQDVVTPKSVAEFETDIFGGGLVEEAIDFENRFADAPHVCETPESVVAMLNAELTRLDANKAKPGSIKPDVKGLATGRRALEDLKDDSELGFDIEQYIEKITAIPKKGVFGSGNVKMEKSKGKKFSTIHTGLPAVTAIVYDKEKKVFYKISTCPAAGACLKYCYARSGQFGMNSGTIMNLLQRINLLMNDPDEYEEMAYEELSMVARQENRNGRQLRIRWNDSGDFFSEEYFNIARRVTDKLIKRGRDVRSYAYTKIAKYAKQGDKNFILNFSKEARTSEVAQMDMDKTKMSVVVPKDVFKGFIETRDKLDEKGQVIVNPKTSMPKKAKVLPASDEVRNAVAEHYESNPKRIKFLHELPEDEGKHHQYDVIVIPGESDEAAQRDDVRISYLLIH
jgi:hypothetical protein